MLVKWLGLAAGTYQPPAAQRPTSIDLYAPGATESTAFAANTNVEATEAFAAVLMARGDFEAIHFNVVDTIMLRPLTFPIYTVLPAGIINEAYSAAQMLTSSGADGTFSATGLPAGITCSAAGLVSGTPTESGTFEPLISVIDENGGTGSFEFSLTIDAGA